MMHRRLLASVLALALVIQGAAWLSAAEDAPDGRVRSDADDGAQAKAAQPAESGASMRIVQILPLREAIAASKPERAPLPPEAQAPPQVKAEALAEKVVDRSASEGARSVASQGEWPAIELVYDGIGLDRYIVIAERIGRFHLLMEGRALGQAVSLRHRQILPSSAADLVTERPYLVSDPAIVARLPEHLPAGADRKNVLLLLRDWADRALWAEIREVASEKGLALAEIARVSGFYGEDWLGAYVVFETAITRGDGRSVALGRRLRLPG